MSEHLRQELSDQFARIGKALGNGRRLELLELLSQGERSVEALAQASGLSVANTSQHLQQLRQAGLVEGHKTGQHVYYSLADARVVSLLDLVHQLAESRLAEVSRLVHNYLGVHDQLEPVTPDDLLERAQEGLVTVLDVRPPEEFEAGHLPGAVNIPLEELKERLPELAQDREVIAYCRGPTASWPTRRWNSCAPPASVPGACARAILSGVTVAGPRRKAGPLTTNRTIEPAPSSPLPLARYDACQMPRHCGPATRDRPP